jgi:glycolate oxidase FAD binding subunit
VVFEEDWTSAQRRLLDLMRRPLPLSGAFHDGERLHLRLSGGETAVAEAKTELGGEETPLGLWQDLRDMRLGLLPSPRLWRLSLPRAAVVDGLGGSWLIDWAGAQRWLVSEAPGEVIRGKAAAAGGHATLFRGAAEDEAVYHPLERPLFDLHRRLAAALDPAGVLNPGRMYEGL